jgi:hypothetical protein
MVKMKGGEREKEGRKRGRVRERTQNKMVMGRGNKGELWKR